MACGLERYDMIDNFTVNKLCSLRAFGLHSSPTDGLTNFSSRSPGSVQKLTYNDLICFPFAVVELKHGMVGGSQEEFCYCQAANGASAALSMLENLFEYTERKQNYQHVPPVVAFTCIGPSVRLWIAYAVREPNGKIAHVSVETSYRRRHRCELTNV